MGDWAEALIQGEINRKLRGYKAVKYGRAGRITAGDPSFPQFFDEYHEELASNGKRPDLLIFQDDVWKEVGRIVNYLEDISELGWRKLPQIASRATLGIEIRSSKYYAIEFERKTGKPQSFTPKLEDLPIVMRWIVVHKVPFFFVQVFFDCAYIISFEKILNIIGKTGKYYIEQVERNQRKSTFYIPLSEGVMIGLFKKEPSWEGRVQKREDGRIEPYVVPRDGELDLNIDILRNYVKL
jgi:hypothetical protein